jgi:gamma-glutamyltranspeptidase/glutathione hydrolase
MSGAMTGAMPEAYRTQQWQNRKPAVSAAGGVVVAQHALAARIGAETLARGGNAVDAAIATGFAVSVLEPWMSGLGGGGTMVVHRVGQAEAAAIDFGMPAPALLDPAAFPLEVNGSDGANAGAGMFAWPKVVDDRNITGAQAVGVPGQVDGMRVAHEAFGSLAWGDLIEPARRLAEDGLYLDWYAAHSILLGARDLSRFPESRRVYLADGMPPVPRGEEGPVLRLRLGRLAATLARLQQAGARDFYEGAIAASIETDMQAAGGWLDRNDLATYRATLLPALAFDYRDVTVQTAPGLTAGPTLQRVLERWTKELSPQGDRPDGAAYAVYARTLDDAYRERFDTLGDDAEAKTQPACTTHLSVVDRDGNMVALTQTLLSRFGSKLMLPGTGIMTNNAIMWFDPRPGRPNSLAPGKRPLSNMCPTVLAENGVPRAALGASGGRRIMPAVAQLVSYLVDYGMDLETAMAAPRISATGEGRATIDPRLSADEQRAIAAAIDTVPGERAVYPVLYAAPQAVARDAASGRNNGAADPALPWSGAVAEPD